MASKRLVCLSCAARASTNPCWSGGSEARGDRLSGAAPSRGSPPKLYQARTALIPSATDPGGLRDREWDLTIARSSSVFTTFGSDGPLPSKLTGSDLHHVVHPAGDVGSSNRARGLAKKQEPAAWVSPTQSVSRFAPLEAWPISHDVAPLRS